MVTFSAIFSYSLSIPIALVLGTLAEKYSYGREKLFGLFIGVIAIAISIVIKILMHLWGVHV